MPPKAPSWIQIIASAISAGFGVQSNKNRARDFKYGKPHHYILAGLILVPVFVLLLLALVHWVVNTKAL